MGHLQTDTYCYLCQLVAADVQQCEGCQGFQWCTHVCESIVMEIQYSEVVHSLQVCRCYLGNSRIILRSNVFDVETVNESREGLCMIIKLCNTLPFQSCCGLFSGLAGYEGGLKECWSDCCVAGINALVPPTSEMPTTTIWTMNSVTIKRNRKRSLEKI